jgi:DNA repair exonuclease SbcCD ATPase subunit
MNTLNNLNLILGLQLTMGIPEFIIAVLGALILGFTLHFVWKSKKSLQISDIPSSSTGINDNDNWKLKYYNDMDMQERAQQHLRERLNELQESEQILTIELEESRKEIENLRLDLDDSRKELEELQYQPAADVGKAGVEHAVPAEVMPMGPAADYLSQLRFAQEKLVEHNSSIHRLLQHIELLGESEKKNQELQQQNSHLLEQLRSSEQLLAEKDGEIGYLRHQQKLAEEMSLRLDKAYQEYHLLQEKLEKLQGYLTQPFKRGADYEELQTSYYKLGKEHDEVKLRQISLREENQRLSRILADTEEKLKEANFQRLQFQKRTVFLEELNHDLQEISEHNKKIEGQLRRVSDMEALLAKVTGPSNSLPNG